MNKNLAVLPSGIYAGDCFEVTYNVTNHWADQYQCEMILRNTGTETIQDWCLAFVSDQTFDQIWNCSAESVNGLTVLHNAGYNQDIAVGEAVYIGFITTVDDIEIPEKYALLGEPEALSPESYTAELSMLENWGSGYTAALTITNNTAYMIEDWSLEFDWDHTITSVWNAELTAQDGKHFRVSNAGYNQNIVAGGSVTVCIQSEFGTFVTKAPAKFQTAMRVVKALGNVVDGVTLTLQAAKNAKNDIMSISYICSSEIEYGKAIELLNTIIDYSDNSDMRKAAKNLKNAMNSDVEEFLLKATRVTEDILSGAAQFSFNYALGEAGPIGFAIATGLTVGEFLWNTGSVDTQSLATIAMGDTGVCYGAFVSSYLEYDNSDYYTISGDAYYMLSVLAQTRIVGENEFNETAQSYSWLYDFLTGIKSAAEDAAEGTVRSIYRFTDSHPLLYSNPNYEGASVSIS